MLPTDIDDMADLVGDPEVMRFYPGPKTREQAAAWIAWNQRNYAEHGHGLWIIETHEGDFVGDCVVPEQGRPAGVARAVPGEAEIPTAGDSGMR